MRLYLVLLPLLLFGQSNLWSWQTTTTMTREDIQAQLREKQQELDVLLTANNLTMTALARQQQIILKEAYGVLGLDTVAFIGKADFVQDCITILGQYRTDLINLEDLEAPIATAALLSKLKITFGIGKFELNERIYLIIASALSSGTLTRKEVAEKINNALDVFDRGYIEQQYKGKDNKSMRKELAKYKSLYNVLPDRASFIANFKNNTVEDTTNANHPTHKSLKNKYGEEVHAWLSTGRRLFRRLQKFRLD